MSALRFNSMLRIGLVLAALISWFAFSNRCALGQLLSSGRSVAVQHGCCEQKEPRSGKTPSEPGSQECCKAFHALMNPAAKAPAVEAAIVARTLVFEAELPSTELCFYKRAETGPPAGSSFIELVLHRSLRSHAPPVFA